MKQLTGKLKGKVLTGVICAVLVLAGVLLLPPLIRTALAATSGDYEYTVNKDGTTVTITGYTGAGGDITIPDTVTDGANTYTVTAIGEAFFNVANVTGITIPEGVDTIGANAFYRCNDLASISIPASVSVIETGAFNQAYGLIEISVNTLNEHYASLDGVLFDKSLSQLICYPSKNSRISYTVPDSVTVIGEGAFSVSKLSNILLPNSVTIIGAYAFGECMSLESITLPDSVTEIGELAFNWCTAVTQISIPDHVETIGQSAFSECFALKKIDVGAGNPNYASINGVLFNKGLTQLLQYPLDSPVLSYSIPDGVLTVDNGAFRGCRNLSELNISASIISIDNNNFLNCYKLKAITVAEGNAYYSSQEGVMFNKQKTRLMRYPGSHAGTAYSIPSSVTAIDQAAFYECFSLADITIPEGIAEIPGNTFYQCTMLSKVTLPGSIVNIEGYAFAQCSQLKDITLSAGLKFIAPKAFEGCVSLTSIVIPASVETIYSGAFQSCKYLLSAYFTGDAPELGADVFEGCHDGFKVYYAAGKTGYTNPWHGSPVSEYDPAAPVKHHIFVESEDDAYGTVTGGGTYNTGVSITLKAVPKEGYRFVGWAEGGNGGTLSIDEVYALTNPVYTFTVNGGGIFTAKFAPIDTPSITAAVSAGYNSIRLTWNAAAGAAGYEIWRATSAAGAYIKVNTATATTYTDSNLTTGSTYYYKIKAYCTASTATTLFPLRYPYARTL